MTRLTTFLSVSISILLIISGTALGIIISKLDPYAKPWHPLLLYAALLLFMFSAVYLIGFYLRRTFGVRELLAAHMAVSARQALWLALLVSISFLLLALGLFSWWNALLLVLCLIFLESYFLFK